MRTKWDPNETLKYSEMQDPWTMRFTGTLI